MSLINGEMVEPLRDPVFFARVFLDDGVLTWPNGFDLDSIALHMEMKRDGLLRQAVRRPQHSAMLSMNLE